MLKRLMFEGVGLSELSLWHLSYGICHKIVGKEYGICHNLELRSGHKGIQGIRNAEHPDAPLNMQFPINWYDVKDEKRRCMHSYRLNYLTDEVSLAL